MASQTNDNQMTILEEALARFIDESLQGVQPQIDEFVEQYPQCEAQLKRRIRDLHEIDFLFDSLIQADEAELKGTTPPHDLVGQQLASFRIVKVIGRGGMGVVYLARDTKLDRYVAIKSMPTGLLRSSTRLKNEAKLLASLNHPNIAVIYDIIEHDEGFVYLILEHVPGQTLAERISCEPLTLEETLSIGRQIAEAVSAAHKKGVIHRDLKPGNIKITPDGQVKVLDFGLAKSFTKEDKSSGITEIQPGRVIGTPVYMSPEQARGKDTDHRTDIWSFGCIMYQMLTRRLPFEAETATDTLAGIIGREPNWELLPPETPANIRALVRRCLEKDPDKRLDNITDVVLQISDTLSKPVTVPVPAISPGLKRAAMVGGAVLVLVLFAVALRFLPGEQAQPSSKEIRLVVLPFDNLGPAGEEWFADGMTDEITTRLAGIHGLAVISRQSATQCKKSGEKTQQIAEELGVDYILEGTIQREKPSDSNSLVRIRAQLIRASDDIHVWTQSFDNDMSEVFRLQSEVAEKVAQALDVTLLEPERRALASRPTGNIEEYEYYLRGNDYFNRGEGESDFIRAIQMYQMAVDLDPEFALAYARLSQVHAAMYWFHYDRSDARLGWAWETIQTALRLNSDLPEVHAALGWYYYHARLDYDHALEQFEIARKSQPNNSDVLLGIASVQRRQGRFDQAAENLKKAYELDPLSAKLCASLGQTLGLLRKYQEAEYYLNRHILLFPDLQDGYYYKASIYYRWKGSTKEARAVLEEALRNTKLTEKAPIFWLLVTLDLCDGNYQEALKRLSLKPEDHDDQHSFIPTALQYAQIYGYMNKKELAGKNYEEARSILEAKIQEGPNDARFHSSLGIAYAGLGRKEEAIYEGELAVELLPVSKEAWRGRTRIADLAKIYVMVDEFEKAIKELEFLLSTPGYVTIHLLRLDPAWAPLRDHPRFQKLLGSAK